ncbi:Vitamin D(3) 25-hydroxylase [Serratia quinivorans]|uniref:cytochrome P450 n=1 Tax=Serratia quinivorans TaxID=137545 RepID=UPI00217A1CB1|nr:cytochrome P450 [Serratia quinivorans]CAI0925789.1 Vitamin D(3) 25-hydroxylase [Serratia quinivorans]CAI0942976.1 Vitamin D(3) 25-hydroxylase [Serratia quinivorans]CAI1731909.1 Vitamin D(3) 25-hydroxylase [Serratia quinivorans]CAI2094231.1 Vitamin D(3) 25-hydroxylase [Serratia quinivorans]CAI2459572.1 Vitamin D(3) 25-hydroxylase [Serratia quinivorans]
MTVCPYSRALAAVTSDDPLADYMQMVPMAFQPDLQCWVAASPAAVRKILHSSDFGVRPADEPIPAALLNTPAQPIFGALVRMQDGEQHLKLKAAVLQTLAAFDAARIENAALAVAQELMPLVPPDANQITRFNYALPVCVIASLLGVPADEWSELVDDILDFSRCIAPGGSKQQVERGILAGRRLSVHLAECSGPLWLGLQQTCTTQGIDRQAAMANAIGLMFQACEGTAGLIGQALLLMRNHAESAQQLIDKVLSETPSIQNTRRFALRDTQVAGYPILAGQSVLVLLCTGAESFAFGEGVHRCPGADWARIIAQCGIQHLSALGLDLQLLHNARWRVSQNARVPEFTSGRSAL